MEECLLSNFEGKIRFTCVLLSFILQTKTNKKKQLHTIFDHEIIVPKQKTNKKRKPKALNVTPSQMVEHSGKILRCRSASPPSHADSVMQFKCFSDDILVTVSVPKQRNVN